MMESSGSIFAFCALLFCCAAFPAGADPETNRAEIEALLRGLSEGQMEELFEKGELSHIISPAEGPSLVPGPRYGAIIAGDFKAIDYTIGVEVLNIIPGGYKGFTTVAAANLLLELSTLEGLEYYSASREKMRTLFVQSYVIKDPESEIRVADPTVKAVPAEGSVTVFQQDKTFGKNKLSLSYQVTQSTIYMATENITRFTWGLLPMIAPGCLHMHVVIYLTENFIVYYGNFGAKAVRVGLFEKRMYDSFYNRLVALSDWFEQKLPSDLKVR